MRGGGGGHGPMGGFDADAVNVKVETKILKRIVPYVRPYIPHLLAGLVFMLLVTVTGLITPYLEAQAIDTFITNTGDLTAEARSAGIARIALWPFDFSKCSIVRLDDW